MSLNAPEKKFVPGCDSDAEDVFKYPFTVEEETIEYIRRHGRIMFIVRGIAGTGKDGLTAMLCASERFPSSIVCSADDYFKNTFSSKTRDPRGLQQSHLYCQNKVDSSCLKKNHPVIVKNTHVRKFEIQKYFDLAAKYGYTVVVISTMSKFEISPDILANSNTKGLDEEYFRNRLQQWEDIVLYLTGWFINSEDSSFLLHELQISLAHLLLNREFCQVLNISEKERLLNHYEARELLYCVASYDNNFLRNFNEIQDLHGKCLIIIIQGFLVTPKDILAIVNLVDVMKVVQQKKISMESIISMKHSFQSSSTFRNANFKMHNSTTSFNTKFNSFKHTAILDNWEENFFIDLNCCSFMHLLQEKSERTILPWNMRNKFFDLLKRVADANGIIYSNQFKTLGEGFKSCRTGHKSWILTPPSKIIMKSLFTGLYA